MSPKQSMVSISNNLSVGEVDWPGAWLTADGMT